MDRRARIDAGPLRLGWDDQLLRSFNGFLLLRKILSLTELQGAFQDYYESTLLPSSSSASISLIGSLQVFFLYAGGPITGRIFDAYGTTVSASVWCLW